MVYGKDNTPEIRRIAEQGGRLPQTITAAGKVRTVSQHMRDFPHSGITAERVEHVLDHWLVRGIRTELDGSQSWCYLAFVYGMDEMVRVAVSMDDETIITAFRDRTATRHWNRGNQDYFIRNYQNLEERDAG